MTATQARHAADAAFQAPPAAPPMDDQPAPGTEPHIISEALHEWELVTGGRAAVFYDRERHVHVLVDSTREHPFVVKLDGAGNWIDHEAGLGWRPDGRVVRLPGSAGDVADQTGDEILARARQVLIGQQAPDHPYPVHALGPLSDACTALAEGAQVRPAMAGQSLLACAALLTQHTADVRGIEAIKPLSLYALTIGESGDGKSTADTIAQAAIQEHQRRETRAYLAALDQIESTPKGEARDAPPPEPYRIARDGTVEGIRRGFAHGVASQGVFSSEAAAMLAGYGMSQDNRAKTAATLNGIWDAGEISVSRATSGRVQLYDRRLSIHWLIQPAAAHEAMGDPLLSQIGFWPRFLLAWPEPSAPRAARPWRSSEDGHLQDYYRACRRLLEGRPLGPDCSDLVTIEPTTEAMDVACRFFEKMEHDAKDARGELREIKPFAVRSTELAFRVAGVLAAFGGQALIDADVMRSGIALAYYSLKTWRSVFGDRDETRAREGAYRLLSWLVSQQGMRATETAMIQLGPKALRSRSARDTAVSVLDQHGLIYREGAYWYAGGAHHG